MAMPDTPIGASKAGGNVPLGMVAMSLAALLFAIANGLTKFEVSRYPVGEVLFFRSLTSFTLVALFVLPGAGLKVFGTQMPGAHFARGLSQSVSQAFTVLALGLMPLSSTIAINFSAPLWAALISVLWLSERPSVPRMIALGGGFIGVLVVATPSAGTLQLGSAFALANAVMYGSVTVAVRRMSKTESWRTLLIWQLATIAILHSALLVFGFAMPSLQDAVLLAACGAANAIAQYLWTRSLQLAPATAASPFYYTMLPWSMAIGFVVWGDIPTTSLAVGSSIVVVASLALLMAESRPQAGISKSGIGWWRDGFRLTCARFMLQPVTPNGKPEFAERVADG